MFKTGYGRLRTAIPILLALTGAGCATSGAVPQPFPRPGGSAAAPATPGVTAGGTSIPHVTDGYAVAGTALGLRGIPYRNGGADPSGFDCSGFIWYVFGQHGVHVARTVSELFREGVEVNPNTLEAGDLLFFNTQGAGASHVGMAIGGDEFVHAPSSRGEVRVERMSSQYWAARFVGARRIQ